MKENPYYITPEIASEESGMSGFRSIRTIRYPIIHNAQESDQLEIDLCT